MIPVDKVKGIIERHEILEKELSSGAIEKKLFASKSKEYSELNTVINNAKANILNTNNYRILTPYQACFKHSKTSGHPHH